MSTPTDGPNINLAGKTMSSSLKARLRRLKFNRSSPFTTPLSHRRNSSLSRSEVKESTDKVPIPLNFNLDRDDTASDEVASCSRLSVKKCDEIGELSKTVQPTLDELNKCADLVLLQKWTKECRERLKAKKETLRKLKLVKMYRTKNNPEELTALIDKWREVSQEAVQDLVSKLPEPKPKLSDFLKHLNIDEKLLRYNEEYESFD